MLATVWIWLLLLGGLVDNVQHGSRGGDRAALRRKTWIPTVLWAFVFTMVSVAAIILAGLILLGAVDLSRPS